MYDIALLESPLADLLTLSRESATITETLLNNLFNFLHSTNTFTVASSSGA